MRRVNSINSILTEIRSRLQLNDLQDVLFQSEDELAIVVSYVPILNTVISSNYVYQVFPRDESSCKLVIKRL